MSDYPETPEERKALDDATRQIQQINPMVVVQFPKTLRAVLRMVYLAGAKEAVSDSIKATCL